MITSHQIDIIIEIKKKPNKKMYELSLQNDDSQRM